VLLILPLHLYVSYHDHPLINQRENAQCMEYINKGGNSRNITIIIAVSCRNLGLMLVYAFPIEKITLLINVM